MSALSLEQIGLRLWSPGQSGVDERNGEFVDVRQCSQLISPNGHWIIVPLAMECIVHNELNALNGLEVALCIPFLRHSRFVAGGQQRWQQEGQE